MFRPLTTRVLASTALATVAAGMFVLPGSPATASSFGIQGTTQTGDNVQLRNLDFTMHFEHHSVLGGVDKDLTPSPEMKANTKNRWQVDLEDSYYYGELEVTFKYEIFDGAGKPTGFWLHANFYEPRVGANSAWCDIVSAHPDKGGVRTFEAPYTCGWSGSGINDRTWSPKPILTVNAATEVKDAAEAGKLLAEHCSEKHDEVGCTYINATLQEFVGEQSVASEAYQNLATNEVSRSMEWDNLTSETASVNAGKGFEATYGALAKTNTASKLGHTWAPTHSRLDVSDLPVPGRSVGWFEYAPAMQTITGDWVINIRSKAWILRNVSFTSANPHGAGMLSACSGGLKDWSSNHTCLPPVPVGPTSGGFSG